MNRNKLVLIDNFFKPLYFFCKWLKSLAPIYKVDSEQYIIVKFFGLGSICRIKNVLDQIDIPTESVTFISFAKNKALFEFFGMNVIYINTKNPFVLISSTISVIWRVWQKKQTKILDMERAANLSGIFRIILSIRKSCVSFSFETDSVVKYNQSFISLNHKSAISAIAEMFGKEISTVISPNTANGKLVNNTILININAGNYLPERMFPMQQFAALIIQLNHVFPRWQFMLLGSKNEVKRVSNLENYLLEKGLNRSDLINTAGQQSLKELMVLMQTSKMLITNDSGPLHFAQIQKLPTVAIWGPTSPFLVGYSDSNMLLNIKNEVHCSPCFIHPKSKVAQVCHGELTCFRNMQTEKIVGQIKNFIDRKEQECL